MSTFIILVATQLPENLGAVARVMGNFAQTQLRLVTPKVSIDDPKAIAMAVSAKQILTNAVIFDSFKNATADCHTVIGTTANPRDVIKHYMTPRAIADDFQTMPGPIGIVFGPERTGLTTDQIALCNATVQIPVNPEFSSLNLSHAVGIVLYELYHAQTNSVPFWQHGKTQPATTGEVDVFLSYLETKLDQTHFWRTETKKPLMRRNLFGLFKRQTLFQQDLRTLRGMIDALSKEKGK
ncbi:MAG: RNA methyltransferase [Pseudomonadota bacterium]